LKLQNKNYEFQNSSLVKEKALIKKNLDEASRELERLKGPEPSLLLGKKPSIYTEY
jgi:hypothetical protein